MNPALPGSPGESVDPGGERSGDDRGIVDHHALDRINRPSPWRALDHASRRHIARVPARADPRRGEVDVLGMILAVDPRGDQPHDMHGCPAAPRCQLAYRCSVATTLWNVFGELADDVAKMMDLLLPGNVAPRPARVLNFLVPAHDLPQRLRLGAFGIPHVDRKDQ